MSLVEVQIRVHCFLPVEVSIRIELISDLLDKAIESPPADCLGRGTYGEVYPISPLHVMKSSKLFIPTEVQGKAEDFTNDSSIRELSFLTRYSHPNIVSYRTHRIWNGNVYIALERGRSLWKTTDDHRGAVRCKMIPRLLFNIVSALRYLWAQGIVHQDIKPSNIIIMSTGEAKLIDFGGVIYAKEWARESKCTDAYRAPEAFECDCPERKCNRKYCDIIHSKGDVFSLAIACMDFITKRLSLLDGAGKPVQRKWLHRRWEYIIDKYHVFSRLREHQVGDVIPVLQAMSMIDHKHRIGIEELYQHPYFDRFRGSQLDRHILRVDLRHNIDQRYIFANQGTIDSTGRKFIITWMAEALRTFQVISFLPLAASIFDRLLCVQSVVEADIDEFGCAVLALAGALYDQPLDPFGLVKHNIAANVSQQGIQQRIGEVIHLLGGDLWRYGFDRVLKDTYRVSHIDWNRVVLICMNHEIFSDCSRAVNTYLYTEGIASTVPLKRNYNK